MPTAEARVSTDRAGRYLIQLCEHTARISTHGRGHGGPHTILRHAEHTGTEGIIDFDGGRCTLRVTADELVLLAEADDRQRLRLVQDAITARLQKIGRRDQLTVSWRDLPGWVPPGV